MKQEELKGIIGNHTADGEVNFEEAIKEVNVNLDKTIAGKVEAKAKDVASSFNEVEIKEAGASELLKELDFENKDALVGALSTAKSEDKELVGKVKTFEKNNAKLQKELDLANSSVNELQTKSFNSDVMNLSLKAGVNKDMVDDFTKIIDFGNIDKKDSEAVEKHIGQTLESKKYFQGVEEQNNGFGGVKPKGKEGNASTSFGSALDSIRNKK